MAVVLSAPRPSHEPSTPGGVPWSALFHAIDSGTNHIDDRKLVSLLGMVEHENAKATEAVRALNSVADFFSSDNLAHLHAWQRPFGLKNFG